MYVKMDKPVDRSTVIQSEHKNGNRSSNNDTNPNTDGRWTPTSVYRPGMNTLGKIILCASFTYEVQYMIDNNNGNEKRLDLGAQHNSKIYLVVQHTLCTHLAFKPLLSSLLTCEEMLSY